MDVTKRKLNLYKFAQPKEKGSYYDYQEWNKAERELRIKIKSYYSSLNLEDKIIKWKELLETIKGQTGDQKVVSFTELLKTDYNKTKEQKSDGKEINAGEFLIGALAGRISETVRKQLVKISQDLKSEESKKKLAELQKELVFEYLQENKKF
ncbi:hypothetical protein [endosymbiont GvMRE of Glomus versiforme]|uniref:hypothetical protein n=1 Tax=endosymbiont GvMRE of Glomus versiforme TaxID=2039283 RepID=UPI0011C42184|nr:hypothetical protein [endosymbiont GvMRE of Glomus versiforme]